MVTSPAAPYRLGFAVKVLGGGGLKEADRRRWQNEPSLARSLEYLDVVFDYLHTIDVRVYRLSSDLVPYGTHPDLPQFDYRRQLEACRGQLEHLAAKARTYGLRLSCHPAQYVVMSSPDERLTTKSLLDLEQDAAVLDALGQGREARVVIHVGGQYGDKASALERWKRAYHRLGEPARTRLVVEHDERSFTLGDVLGLHEATDVPVVFDLHHHRLNPTRGLEATADALAAAVATWPAGVRPKVHVSSPRTQLDLPRPPRLEQHADLVSPWDMLELVRAAQAPIDVMLEAKAKDLALLWLREQLPRVAPDAALTEERGARARAGSRDGQTGGRHERAGPT